MKKWKPRLEKEIFQVEIINLLKNAFIFIKVTHSGGRRQGHPAVTPPSFLFLSMKFTFSESISSRIYCIQYRHCQFASIHTQRVRGRRVLSRPRGTPPVPIPFNYSGIKAAFQPPQVNMKFGTIMSTFADVSAEYKRII